MPALPGLCYSPVDERDAVGIYRVLSYHVRLLIHEFGIRTAMGAQSRDILVLIGIRGYAWRSSAWQWGLAMGLAGAVALARRVMSEPGTD